MPKFKIAGHESFPEDQYIKEVVYIDVKAEDCTFRQAWVRKASKNGGSFWGIISAGVSKNGRKEYLKSFMCSDNFFEKDVIDFLNKRSWEKVSKSENSDGLPF